MRYNLARHSMLKKLAERLFSIENNEAQIQASLVGLTLAEIDNHLSRSTTERELILSGLSDAKEIEAFKDEFDRVSGYFITDNIGLNSFVEKKYLNRNNDIILNWLKNVVQLLIPIASLAVAALALTLKMNTFEKDTIQKIQTIKSEIIKLNSRIDKIEAGHSRTGNIKQKAVIHPK